MQSAQVFSLERRRFPQAKACGSFEARLSRSAVVGFSLLEPVSRSHLGKIYCACIVYSA
jgi:hypothetical protein